MPSNDRAEFFNLSGGADTEKRRRHDDEQPHEPIQRMKLVAVVGNAQGPAGKTEVGRADGGAASLVRQGVDAANAAFTLATMKAGLDPASLSSPDWPVNNTAAHHVIPINPPA